MREAHTADVTWALDNLGFSDCLFFSFFQQEALSGVALDGLPFLHEAVITIQLLQIRHTAGPIKTKSYVCVLLKAASL